MVSPSPSTTDTKVKKYIGNKLNLNLSGNKKTSYLVVGNECCVQLKDNHTSIKIVGERCNLQVLSGRGRITYIGNNGVIYLDKSIDEDVLTYVGNNGLISSKSGTIQRRSSDGDIRNCKSSKVINLEGSCNVTVASDSRNKVFMTKFTKITSTISLPHLQIQVIKRRDGNR